VTVPGHAGHAGRRALKKARPARRSQGSPVVVVADPYSAGALLAPALRAAGCRPVAAISPGGPPAVRPDFRPADFDAVVRADDSDTIAALRPHRPGWIVAGAEEGIELADQLAAALTPGRANVPALAGARRHKGRSAEAMARAGFPVLRTLATGDETIAADWLRREGLTKRALVLKPPRSAGADGVALVAPGEDWRAPFRRLRGARNALEVRDDEVIVQEYAAGAEYAVDTLSIDGRHFPAAFFSYMKDFVIYRTVDVLPITAPPAAQLFALVARALDAVGIRSGACHTEVVVGPGGPRVIEINARLHGGAAPVMSRLASGDSQLDQLVAVCAGRPPAPPAVVTRAVRAVYLSAPVAGTCRAGGLASFAETARGLPSFAGMTLTPRPGALFPATADLFTTLGRVLLAHGDPGQIELDSQRVRDAEHLLCTPAGRAEVLA
jgi:hypothetical protein